MKYSGMNSPITSNVTNPMKKGEKTKNLKKRHTETLAKTGLRPPKSPV